MPKGDLVRKINLPSQRGGSKSSDVPIVGVWGTGLVNDSDRVDGFHASRDGLPGTIPVLNEYGFLPESTIPEVSGDAPIGHKGRQYIGPTAYLVAAVAPADLHIDVSNNQWTGDERVILSHWSNANYETVLLTGAAASIGPNRWRYPLQRSISTVPAQFYPIGTTAVSLGHPDLGGYIVLNSAGGVNTPRVAVYQNDPDNVEEGTWKGAFGKLSGLPSDFTSLFPDDDFSTLFGVATDNGFFSGSINAISGSLHNLLVKGTITVKDTVGEDVSSWLELGNTMAGFGWVLRGTNGPAVMALAPYADDGGVISPVAFIINNGTEKGLYYHELEDGEGRLEINVNTLVKGNLRVGETFMVGTGEWGTDFAGVAIDSEWGLVGISSTDTFDQTDPGTYQVMWDKTTGKFKTGGGVIGFGKEGMTFNLPLDEFVEGMGGDRYTHHDTDPVRPVSAKWYYAGTKQAEVGALYEGSWFAALYGDDNGNNRIQQSIWFDLNGGLEIQNSTPDTNNSYIAPYNGTHKFYIGDNLVADFGSGMPFFLPATIAGTKSVNYWTEKGYLGFGNPVPQAMLEIVGDGTDPQFQISNSALDWGAELPDDYRFTRLRVDENGTTWNTSGDIVLGPRTNAIVPYTDYGVDLGSSLKRFGTIFGSELDIETLVAAEKIATVGGRVLVAPTTQLTSPAESSNTAIFVKADIAVIGDILISESAGIFEAMLLTGKLMIGSIGAPNTTYRYTVTRNLNGLDSVPSWPTGTAVVNTGQAGAGDYAGSGWIDLYSFNALAKVGPVYTKSHGPTIAGSVRQSNDWWNWRERWAIGNLHGLYGYGSATWGVGFGDPIATHITIDDVYGYRLRNHLTTIARWDVLGNLMLGATGAIRLTVEGDASFSGTVTVGTGIFVPPGT